MLTVTTDFKAALQQPIKRVLGYIVLQDGTEIHADGDLISYTVSSTGDFLKTAMSELKATFIGEKDDIKGSMIDVYYGVYHDDAWDYVLKGKFNITEAKYNKASGTTDVTGYDNMILFSTLYTTVGEYPSTLFAYLSAVCAGAGVSLENTSIFNGTLTVEEDEYKNLAEYTFRDVLEDICEVAVSYAVINPNGNLELRHISDTGEVIDYNNLIDYETGDKWGGINSLVLSRQPQNDDVYTRDDADINAPTTKNILDLNKFKITYSSEES